MKIDINKYCLIHWALCLFLSACGFRPLYDTSDDSDNSKLNAGVQVESIEGHEGQQLRVALEDLLNPPGGIPPKPAYRLNVTFSTIISPIGTARDGTVSRFNIYLTSKYTLTRLSDNKPITNGRVNYIDSYNNQINSYFSTYISEEDALKRGITELSELYRERLAVYLDAGAPAQEIKPIPERLPNPWQPNNFLNPIPDEDRTQNH